MGLNDTGTVNGQATAGAGRGKSISRDAGDTGPVNPNATKGAGRGYEPVRLDARAMAERVSYNQTEVVIRKSSDLIGGGGGGGKLNPWQPIFSSETVGTSTTYKCHINLGSVNNVAATNWNDEHALSMAEDDFKFVVLTVTASSGKITGLTISIDENSPETDDIARDAPPVSWKILLGAIGRTEAKMIVTTNLQAVAAEVFRESKPTPAVGAEPFRRWWRWMLSTL